MEEVAVLLVSCLVLGGTAGAFVVSHQRGARRTPALPPPPRAPLSKLSTSLDVEVDIEKRVAGFERGTLRNEWVCCTYEVRANKTSGAAWKATFIATDDVSEVGRNWQGNATTRRAAKGAALDTLTKHIATVAQRRVGAKS